MIDVIEVWCMERPKRFTPVTLFYIVCLEFELSGLEMANADRQPHRTEARCCFTWFVRKLKAGTLKDIGEWLDRDHSSIIKLMQRCENFLSIGDEQVTTHIINVYNRLNQLQTNERV